MALPTPTATFAVSPSVAGAQPGGMAIWFIPTAVNYATPTLAELSAGTAISHDATSFTGFTVTPNDVAVTTYGRGLTTNASGIPSLDTSSITTLRDKTGTNDALTLMPQGTTGGIVFFPGGVVTSGKMDVWQVRVSACTPDAVAPGDLQTVTTSFSVVDVPHLNVTIPTT